MLRGVPPSVRLLLLYVRLYLWCMLSQVRKGRRNCQGGAHLGHGSATGSSVTFFASCVSHADAGEIVMLLFVCLDTTPSGKGTEAAKAGLISGAGVQPLVA